MAMGGPAASCSTSCCYGTDTVPQHQIRCGSGIRARLEAWQVDGKPDSFCSIFLDCVEQEEQTLVDLIERLRHLR